MSEAPSSFAVPGIGRVPRSVGFLAIGFVVALLARAVPFVPMVIGGLSSVPHECGHAAVAIFFGRLAVPCIVITPTTHQLWPLAVAVWVGIGALAWRERRSRARLAALGTIALVYPLLAFTKAEQVLFLLGGHGGEVAFAGLCLYWAMKGGWYQEGERPTYAFLGWSLAIAHFLACYALLTSPAARESYETHAFTEQGNDMSRVAELLSWRFESVVKLMLMVGLVAPALGIVAFYATRKASSDDE